MVWTDKHSYRLFFLLIGVSLAIWGRVLYSTMQLARADYEHSHILLILPLCLGLLYFDRKRFTLPLHPSFRMGALVCVSALAIFVAFSGRVAWEGDWRRSLAVFSFVLWWMGSVLISFGTRIVRQYAFHLCLLLLLIPFPDLLMNWVTEWLQRQSATSARVMFLLAGVPATQDGVMVSIPGWDIEVARQCSSIRSSMMLIITTLVLSHLFLRSATKRLIVLAAAVPLCFIKNGLRIFVICQLATQVDEGFFDGRLHHHGGPVFLACAIAVVGGMVWILRRREARLSEAGAT